jgi:hypothetical protein
MFTTPLSTQAGRSFLTARPCTWALIIEAGIGKPLAPQVEYTNYLSLQGVGNPLCFNLRKGIIHPHELPKGNDIPRKEE